MMMIEQVVDLNSQGTLDVADANRGDVICCLQSSSLTKVGARLDRVIEQLFISGSI
jgi:hypothetical protein